MITIPLIFEPNGIAIRYRLETTVGDGDPSPYEQEMSLVYCGENNGLFTVVEGDGFNLQNSLSPGGGGPDIEIWTYLKIIHLGYLIPIEFTLRFFKTSDPETTLFEETLSLLMDGTPLEYTLQGVAGLSEAISSELIHVRCPGP